MAVHVLVAPWEERKAALQALRETVFIVEQQVPRELEWDGRDPDCLHFMALDETGQMIGCARLTPEGQIGRMAVLKAQRGRGIGRALLDAAVAAAAEQGQDRVVLHAQQHAERFYRKAGFLPEGQPYEEAGIPHITMSKALPLTFERPVLPRPDPTSQRSHPRGESKASDTPATLPAQSFRGEAAAREMLLSALSQPRRRLYLLSPELDPALLDDDALCDALSRFVRSSANTELRILIHSSKLAVSLSHRLIALTRRLDERIHIQKIAEAHAKDQRSFLVWDDLGYWLQPSTGLYEGLLNGRDPVKAARLRERFDYLWERSAPDPELRLLKL